jgi:hypothetical protein
MLLAMAGTLKDSQPRIGYSDRPLDPSTREAFAELVERNNGILGGCWCMSFHPEPRPEELPAIKHRREYDNDAPRPDWPAAQGQQRDEPRHLSARK